MNALSDVKWVPLGLASAKGDEMLVPRLARNICNVQQIVWEAGS